MSDRARSNVIVVVMNVVVNVNVNVTDDDAAMRRDGDVTADVPAT